MLDLHGISQAAFDLIVNEEVTSQSTYNSLYTHPTWPGGASGVTIGIGYDCGYTTARIVRNDWGDQLPANAVDALDEVAGVRGSVAKSHAFELHWITVPWDAAITVFSRIDIPKWTAIVKSNLPNCDKLSPDSFGALVSLTYNRGASFNQAQDRFREMRAIKSCMATGMFDQIPDLLRSMSRLWPTMVGLRNRREHEAQLFSNGLGKPAA